MRLVIHRDIQEPDLAHIEAPFFACSKVRRLLVGNSNPAQMLGIPHPALYAQGFDSPLPDEKLLQEIEEGRRFLVIRSDPGAFQPPVRWQPANNSESTGLWVVDESLLGPGASFNLGHVITRIERKTARAPACRPCAGKISNRAHQRKTLDRHR